MEGLVALAPGQNVGTCVLERLVRTQDGTQVWLATTTTFPKTPMTVRARTQDVMDRASPFAGEIAIGEHLAHPGLIVARESIEIGPWSCVITAGAPGVALPELYEAIAALRTTSETVWTEIVLHVAHSVLAGLDAAHRTTAPDHPKGIVHGGVRPELVEIAPDGAVRLAGFAVKEDDDASQIVDRSGGTVAYLPPEQLGSRTRAPTMDLWAVGALLHEVLDGRRFRGDVTDPRELYRLALTGVVPPLQQPAPAALEQLRAALLAKNPRDRPRDAISSMPKPSAAAITRLAELVRARMPAEAAPRVETPPAPPPPQLDLSQIVPPFVPPPVVEEEGTIAIDPVELAAMRAAGSAPIQIAPPAIAEEDAPVMRRRPANVETPKPSPRAPAPPATLHIPPPPPLEAPRAPEPIVAAPPPRAPPTMAGERIEFDPRVEGTSMTVREERRAKRSFVAILAVAGVVAIVIGVVVGVLIAGDDGSDGTPRAPATDAKTPAKTPAPSGPELQPRPRSGS